MVIVGERNGLDPHAFTYIWGLVMSSSSTGCIKAWFVLDIAAIKMSLRPNKSVRVEKSIIAIDFAPGLL